MQHAGRQITMVYTTMRLQFFSVSAQFPEASQQLLNTFCAQHRVLTVDKQFVDLGAESFWSICVTTIEGSVQESPKLSGNKRERIDYKEVFIVPTRLRHTVRWRIHVYISTQARGNKTNSKLCWVNNICAITMVHKI